MISVRLALEREDAGFSRQLLLPSAWFNAGRVDAENSPSSWGGGVITLSTSTLLATGLTVLAVFIALFHYATTIRRCLRDQERESVRLRRVNADLSQEVDAQHENECAWRIEEARMRSLTRLSADWYWEQDKHFRFTMRSSWAIGNDTIPTERFLGKTRWELSPAPDDPFWLEHRAVLEAHKAFRGLEYQFDHAGKVYWVSVNGEPRFAEDGKFLGYRGIGRDITRRKEIEAALRASEERFQEIINFMPVGVHIKDAKSRITLMNAECERLWGIQLTEIEGTNGSHIFEDDDLARALKFDQQAFVSRQIVEYDSTGRNLTTNEVRFVKEFKKPVFDTAGNPRYLIGISIDITDRKRAEELLRRSRERLRQLGIHQTGLKEQERKRIARDIHDDLGQNLMALRLEISSFVQRTMDGHPKLNQRARSVMENVDLTIRSVRNIINDLRPAVLDLGVAAALEWQVNEFIKRSSLSCTLKIEAEVDEIKLDEADATAMFRVFQESLTNIQRHARATHVQITLSRHAERLELAVSDDGVGGIVLSEVRKKKTFGLLGMRERLVPLGGTLEIRGPAGMGTTLIVSLPLRTSTRAAETPSLPGPS